MTLEAFLIPVLAGLLGGLIGIFLHGRITKDVKILLTFSGSYLFALTILHLLPEVYVHLEFEAGYYVLVGFLLQIVLDFFSKGIEHGHIHKSDQESHKFPTGIFLALFIHSMIEGLPLSEGTEIGHSHAGHHHGFGLIMGIAVHKIPEAIALAALLYHYFSSKKKTLGVIIIYCTATPIGLLIGNYILSGTTGNPEIIYSRVLAIAVGIFLHVSTTIIFESEDHHKLDFKKIIAILLGLGLAILI